MVGALRLSALFNRLESQVLQAPGTFAAEGLEEIDAEFARVVRALETISGRTPS